MRVNDLNLSGSAAAETGRAQGSQPIERDGRNASPARGGSGTDQIELSPLSRALNSSASARSARVSQLAAQYQAGQYQVDPVKVSQAMVTDAFEAAAVKPS